MMKHIYFTCHKVGRYRDMDDINKCFGGLNLLELFNLFRKLYKNTNAANVYIPLSVDFLFDFPGSGRRFSPGNHLARKT